MFFQSQICQKMTEYQIINIRIIKTPCKRLRLLYEEVDHMTKYVNHFRMQELELTNYTLQGVHKKRPS